MAANQTKDIGLIEIVDVKVSCRAYPLAADPIAASSNEARFYFVLIL